MTLLEDLNREYKRYRYSPAEKIRLANNGLQWVLSSNVSAIAKNDDDLIIRFHNGSMYLYPGQAKLFDPMMKSNSKGHFVWVKLRKPKLAYQKIGSLPLDGDIEATDDELMDLIDNQGMAVEQRLREMGMFIPTFANTLNLFSIT